MLDRIKTELPKAQVIILTAHDSLHNAIESIKRGAYHFISKPYAPEELLSLVEKALEKQFLLGKLKNYGRRRSNWRSGWRSRKRDLPQFLRANRCRKLRN
jgi:Response regulator containing CheY-like receiver, AAA-type ATPase, and DNA-binding domains